MLHTFASRRHSQALVLFLYLSVHLSWSEASEGKVKFGSAQSLSRRSDNASWPSFQLYGPSGQPELGDMYGVTVE